MSNSDSLTLWSELRRLLGMSSDQENNWTIDDRSMLYLASAAYRGVFQGGNWAPDHATKIGEGMQECLQRMVLPSSDANERAGGTVYDHPSQGLALNGVNRDIAISAMV